MLSPEILRQLADGLRPEDSVALFLVAAKDPIGNADEFQKYLGFIEEETNELWQAITELRTFLYQQPYGVAMDREHAAKLYAEVLDGVFDVYWVGVASSLVAGVPAKKWFTEGAVSNLLKIKENGTVERNEAGKIMKPEGWVRPDFGFYAKWAWENLLGRGKGS